MTQVTKKAVEKAIAESGLFVKVNPTDGKVTFRLSEPEDNVLYTQLTAAKAKRVITAVFNSSNPKDYSYILTTLVSGRRVYQGVRSNNGLHEVLLGIVTTKAKAQEIRSGLPKGKQGGAKNTRKSGKGKKNSRRARNTKTTTAPASGGSEDTLAEIRELMAQMMEKLS